MSRYSGRLPRTFEQATAMLNGRERRTLANNTFAYRGGSGRINVVHHDSIIAIFYPNGDRYYTNAGYGSASTRERLNALVPAGYGFIQRDYTQHVITPGSEPVPGSSIEISA